jgi:low affinity Fe/Cu permease
MTRLDRIEQKVDELLRLQQNGRKAKPDLEHRAAVEVKKFLQKRKQKHHQ